MHISIFFTMNKRLKSTYKRHYVCSSILYGSQTILRVENSKKRAFMWVVCLPLEEEEERDRCFEQLNARVFLFQKI